MARFILKLTLFISLFVVVKDIHSLTTDSIQLVITNCKTDSCKIANYLHFSSSFYKNNNFNQAAKYANEALRLSIKSSIDTFEAKSYMQVAQISFKQKNYTSAMAEFTKAMQLFEKLGNKRDQAICLGKIGIIYEKQNQYSIALDYYTKALTINESIRDTLGISIQLTNIGVIYERKGDYFKSLDYYYKALDISRKSKDKDTQAKTLRTVGSIHAAVGSYPKALDCYMQALAIREELNDKQGIVSCLNSIGLVHFRLNNHLLALSYYEKSLKAATEINNQHAISNSLIQISSIYFIRKQYHTTIDLLRKAEPISRELNDEKNLTSIYHQLGKCYLELNKPDSSLAYLDTTLLLYSRNNDKQGIAAVNILTGVAFSYKNKPIDAINYINGAISMAEHTGDIENISEGYKQLSIVYERFNKPAEAHLYFKKHVETNDSIQKRDKIQEINRKSMEYEFDKLQQKIKNRHEKIDQESAFEREKQKIKSTYISIVLIGLVVVLVFIINISIYIQKQKKTIKALEQQTTQNSTIIDLQKKETSDINTEYTSSINYIHKVQDTLLSTQEKLSIFFPDSFILFKPKSHTNCDLHYVCKKSGKIIITIIDIPGSNMAVALKNTLLHIHLITCINKFNKTNPVEIIDYIQKSMPLEGSENKLLKFGISVASIDQQTNQLQWAGLINPLWIIRDKKIIEFSADKDSSNSNFIEFNLQSKDIVYLFSNGFSDQKGGERGVKFEYKHLAETLMNMNDIAMQSQARELDKIFDNWRGNFEQNDDTTIIGIRI